MNENQPPHSQPTPPSPQPKKRAPRELLIGLGLLLGAAFIGATWYGGTKLYEFLSQKQTSSEVAKHQEVANDGNKIVTKEEGDIANIVEKVSPSVVSIVTRATGTSPFGAREQEGAGTGIIVSKDGYILTNKHVITGANRLDVVLSDGTKYENVKVLGTDPLNDIAFMKIDNVSSLPAAELGDSSSIRVGQRVVAIGNSLGQYQNTVTSGIISGIGRPISAQSGDTVENLSDLIQTDAAINPGNSGGPLLNLNGQVIGINTAIVEEAQGIGFSIPVNATKGMLKGVLTKGIVERPYLGVNFIPITPDVAKSYNLPVKKGAYLDGTDRTAVVSGGPADKAGLKDGDIITKVGGIEVGSGGGISSLISEYAPGETIEITVLRGNQTLTLKVTLAPYKV